MLALVDGEEMEEEILCLCPLETVDLTMEEDRKSGGQEETEVKDMWLTCVRSGGT